MADVFPFPGVEHGKRILISVLEQRAREEPNCPYCSVAVDNDNLSKGYRDITFQQINDAANRAAHWLVQHLPECSEPFQSFAYAGPMDLRYPILAIAAAKLQKVVALPSIRVTPEGQVSILEKIKCSAYFRSDDLAHFVDPIARRTPGVQSLKAPGLDELFQGTAPVPYIYPKSWEEGKDDPWLVFHSSGTTGIPKVLTFTHRMVAVSELPAALPDVSESHIHQYANRRWYTHLPSLHYVGMTMIIFMPVFVRMTPVVAPPDATPEQVIEVWRLSGTEGALLPCAAIEQLCATPGGLEALRNLKYIHYAGSKLDRQLGQKIASHTGLAPLIGTTESGHHFTEIRNNDKEDWDYFSFQPHAGPVFEHRADDMYELVFVRQPQCPMQLIFLMYPHLDRFETKDLWVKHPTRKGLWNIVGRIDDYVSVTNASGLFVTPVESKLEQHPRVRTALIGGNNCPAPVMLIELVDDESQDMELESGRQSMIESLKPCISQVNETLYTGVQLVPEYTIFAKKDKPFVKTVKMTTARLPTLKLYEEEITGLFKGHE